MLLRSGKEKKRRRRARVTLFSRARAFAGILERVEFHITHNHNIHIYPSTEKIKLLKEFIHLPNIRCVSIEREIPSNLPPLCVCVFAGEKKIVKLLHFPNLTASEQRRLLMGNDSGSGTDDEREKVITDAVDGTSHKPQRKKSSTKRSLDMQRKISLSKLKDLTSPESNNESSPVAANNHSLPLRKTSRFGSMKNGRSSGGYDQYMKQYLQIPMPSDYGEPSSDDLSSEWDSDVPDNKTSDTNKESKVRARAR